MSFDRKQIKRLLIYATMLTILHYATKFFAPIYMIWVERVLRLYGIEDSSIEIHWFLKMLPGMVMIVVILLVGRGEFRKGKSAHRS